MSVRASDAFPPCCIVFVKLEGEHVSSVRPIAMSPDGSTVRVISCWLAMIGMLPTSCPRVAANASAFPVEVATRTSTRLPDMLTSSTPWGMVMETVEREPGPNEYALSAAFAIRSAVSFAWAVRAPSEAAFIEKAKSAAMTTRASIITPICSSAYCPRKCMRDKLAYCLKTIRRRSARLCAGTKPTEPYQ
jgi:hypothetical protein